MKRKFAKTMAFFLAAAMILSLGATNVSARHGRGRHFSASGHNAACDGTGKRGNASQRGGVCDYNEACDADCPCGPSENGCQFVDEDRNGICDNYTKSLSQNSSGKNFTDADEDGVCDNYGTGRGSISGKGLCGGRRK